MAQDVYVVAINMRQGYTSLAGLFENYRKNANNICSKNTARTTLYANR